MDEDVTPLLGISALTDLPPRSDQEHNHLNDPEHDPRKPQRRLNGHNSGVHRRPTSGRLGVLAQEIPVQKAVSEDEAEEDSNNRGDTSNQHREDEESGKHFEESDRQDEAP